MHLNSNGQSDKALSIKSRALNDVNSHNEIPEWSTITANYVKKITRIRRYLLKDYLSFPVCQQVRWLWSHNCTKVSILSVNTAGQPFSFFLFNLRAFPTLPPTFSLFLSLALSDYFLSIITELMKAFRVSWIFKSWRGSVRGDPCVAGLP